MTELETAIRDALHSRADAIEPRETALRTRRPRRWLPPTIAAAVVAVLALAIGLVVARQNSPSTPAASRRPGFVGYRWKLVAVDDVYGHLVVPRRITATIAFGRDGSFQLDDTVNFYSGRYRLAQGGYTPGRIGGTLVGFAGSRRSVIGRVVAAMASATCSRAAPSCGAPVRTWCRCGCAAR